MKLSAGGRELTQPLVVRKDPNTAGTEADIEAQTRMLLEPAARPQHGGRTSLNRIELVRSQLESLGRIVADADGAEGGATTSNQKLIDLEMTAHRPAHHRRRRTASATRRS